VGCFFAPYDKGGFPTQKRGNPVLPLKNFYGQKFDFYSRQLKKFTVSQLISNLAMQMFRVVVKTEKKRKKKTLKIP
jgi:hypothetical protein